MQASGAFEFFVLPVQLYNVCFGSITKRIDTLYFELLIYITAILNIYSCFKDTL